MLEGGGRLTDGDSCSPSLARTDRAPFSCWSPRLPIRHGHPGPCVHAPFLLIPLPASSQVSKQLDTFSKFSGHCRFLLKFLTPLCPIPAMGKGHRCPTHALPGAGRAEEQLAGPGSCEVWGCQGEEPRLQGRHGKAERECYPEPLPLAAPFRSPSAFLASQWPWREADGALNRDHCVQLATGSARNVHLPGPNTRLRVREGTSSPSPDACLLGHRTGPSQPDTPSSQALQTEPRGSPEKGASHRAQLLLEGARVRAGGRTGVGGSHGQARTGQALAGTVTPTPTSSCPGGPGDRLSMSTTQRLTAVASVTMG